tara:strand:+ start:161 stop:559 length:399 start_codon:yes stop_codon:yes gene_type:complete
MLGGMMQSIGVGATIEASEMNVSWLTFDNTEENLILNSNSALRLKNTNDNGNWYIRNGGTNGAELQLGTGNTPGSNIKVTIDGNGSVGIGTTSPSKKLHVAGTVMFSSLPTSNPNVAGELWNNSGVVNISAG